MKILITGIAGFAARHFLNYLNEQEPGSEVAGIYNETYPDFDAEKLSNLTIYLHKVNLLDKEKKVVAKNLRGEDLEKFVEDYFKE